MHESAPTEFPTEEDAGHYQVQISALNVSEIAVCIDILKTGNAVDIRSARRDLPRAHLLAVARMQDRIVAVGCIKHERAWYALKTSRNSGVDFPRDILELGYVAVHPDHRRKQLSQRFVEVLLARHKRRLFATTYSDFMKTTLRRAGFVQKGNEWEGRKNQMVSFWERE